MKKFKILTLSLMVFAMALLEGCSSNNPNDTTGMVADGVNDTNNANDVNDVNNTNTTNTDKNTNTSVTDNQNQENNQNIQFDNLSADSVAEIKNTVNNVVAKVDNVKVPDEEKEKMNRFFELKKELNSVEDQLDQYDDFLDAQYQNGTFKYEDYKTWERRLDELEDKVDEAEDKLEKTFGIKD